MSKYSDEGTCAHTLASLCLNETKTALAFLGRVIEVTDGEHSWLSPSKAQMHLSCLASAVVTKGLREDAGDPEARKFTVDQEMAGYVQTYLDTINNRVSEYYLAGAVKVELLVEQHVPIDHITGERGGGGSADAIIVVTWADGSVLLDVNDLKYGKGVEVSAVGNEQLREYALGTARKLEIEPERVRMSIHQPRIREAPSEDEISWKDLVDWAHWARGRYAVIRSLHERGVTARTADPDIFTPGEKQCQFCLYKSRCPALAKQVEEAVDADFETLDAANELGTDTVPLPGLPDDSEELARKMRAVELVEDWCKAVRAEVERRLLHGIPVPEFKLVQGKRGNRQWGDEKAAEEAMKSMRLRKEEMYDMSLISPTTAEKKFKKESPKRWSRLQALITQSEGKAHVAHVSDPRPALSVEPTDNDFADETGADLAG